MTFKVGETVVYPHHGAATIKEITTRKFGGEDKTYLTLQVAQADLTIQVPADNVEMVGVRDVVDEEGFEEVMDTLREEDIEEPSNWSRRYKANQEKIATGDIVRVAEVVRDLSRRDSAKGLSAGEKRMLAKARQILTSELALAREVDEDTANERLDEILAEAEPEETEDTKDTKKKK
ncbi:CarD family transcriptional regulator [Gleimia hominis]|uniref:CarD family transcriptional regulator n=1 Tax=Gleimia hominis TaxID=595468 RepID=UPI000C7F7FF1|nr:CarD family transcriptional regulator [Gleimia hominis]WIK64417.1 CarD family transcriptional regulator [Gleimia hominis]